MKCDECGLSEATVAYTEFAEGKASTCHLCESCAGKRGVSSLSTLSESLVDILMGLIEEMEKSSQAEQGPTCPGCGLRLSEFRRGGRLGCSRCYSAFREELEPLLRKVHGSSAHAGRVPSSLEPTAGPRREIRKLRAELERAVRREEYERAAELRDLIREKEAAVDAGESDVGFRPDDA